MSSESKVTPLPPTARRDLLLSIEHQVQLKWENAHMWEEDAGDSNTRSAEDKYMATFPYPYMNGVLHLGHGFTMLKADFQCQYQRLKGKKVLYPMAFHVTGMPIAACADKLKRELALYGNPPVFPTEDVVVTDDASDHKQTSSVLIVPEKKKRAGKAKVTKKASKQRYQWNILLEMGVPAAEIHKFADSLTWLQYFPPLAQEHLNRFGLSADWRRAFITTAINPYYDSFIRWQFNTLKLQDKIAFGKRLCIFSPMDNQSCADHDRASGEGVGIVHYTLIKLQLLPPYPTIIQTLLDAAVIKSTQQIYLPAATLRPETMHGQTNAWVYPEGEYGVFDMNAEEVFICTEKSALNMSYQELTRERGKIQQIQTIPGQALLGSAMKAPMCTYERIYVLPLNTIKMDKGTGIVTSVPSESPDDYAALMDLKRKPAFREKYGLLDAAVLPFDTVPVIDTPGLGRQPAVDLCIEAKVQSQNDREKLEPIKERIYKESFAKGIMLLGPHAGQPVSVAQPLIKSELIASGLTAAYSEPESRVVSRSDNECVVAFADQWYLKYGEAQWQAAVRNHVETSFECYNPRAKTDYLTALSWLHEWALSRSYGLGTRVPWDPQFVIESLSDSTVYMAYYTISHFLQQGSLDGSLSKIKPEDLTDEVYNYIFLHTEYPTQCNIPQSVLDVCRNEFQYWYPMDLRVSGKDLIPNHLTFSLYTHAAIWPNEAETRWPKSFYTNGHVLVDGEKMSKMAGNFITIIDAVNEYSADATRFTLADAGDGLEDANFETKSANAAILKLTKEEAWIREDVMPCMDTFRTGALEFHDRVFANELNRAIVEVDQAYAKMLYRCALKAAFHELQTARDAYRVNVPIMHQQLVQRYLQVSALILMPICPHYTQHLWELTGNAHTTPFIVKAKWPVAEPIDFILLRQVSYLKDVSAAIKKSYHDTITKLNKSKSPVAIGSVVIYYSNEYPEWQQQVLQIIRQLYESRHDSPLLERKDVIAAIKALFVGDKKQLEAATRFANEVLLELPDKGVSALDLALPFDESILLTEQIQLVMREIHITNIRIINAASTSNDPLSLTTAKKALPGKPVCYFS